MVAIHRSARRKSQYQRGVFRRKGHNFFLRGENLKSCAGTVSRRCGHNGGNAKRIDAVIGPLDHLPRGDGSYLKRSRCVEMPVTAKIYNALKNRNNSAMSRDFIKVDQ